MKNSATDDLQLELMNAPDLDRFLQNNDEKFNQKDMHSLLSAMFENKGISKAALANRSGVSNVYLHQVFSGRRNPSRNRIICICIGMEAGFEDTQELLKRGGMGLLYPKNRRDAIIIYGLIHKLSLAEVNDKLFGEDEDTLC